MRYYLLCFILFSIPSLLFATPTISNVTGTISDGNQITITSGANDFGANGPTIMIFDDFDGPGAVDGNTIRATSTDSEESSFARVGDWYRRGSDNPVYQNDTVWSGTLAYGISSVNAGSEPQMDARSVGTFTEFFGVWWVRYDDTNETPMWMDNGTYTGWKQVWVRKDHGSTLNGLNTIVYSLAPAYENRDEEPAGGAIGGNKPDACDSIPFGEYGASTYFNTWQRTRVYYYGSNTDGGIVDAWQLIYNGTNTETQSHNFTGVQTTCEADPYGCVYCNGWHRPLASGQSVSMDDFYFAYGPNCRARVEIGSHSTYTSCTNLTICTVDSWSASSITATVRQGSFTTGTAYVFVVDADGAVSSGYEITLGSGSSSTPTCQGISIQ